MPTAVSPMCGVLSWVLAAELSNSLTSQGEQKTAAAAPQLLPQGAAVAAAAVHERHRRHIIPPCPQHLHAAVLPYHMPR